jgi:hypothetical protein
MSTITDTSRRRISDWRTLTGAHVEIRQQGTTIGSGVVDAVTDDGRILWLYSPIEGRRLYEKADFYQAWATEDSPGFHYRVSCSGVQPTLNKLL